MFKLALLDRNLFESLNNSFGHIHGITHQDETVHVRIHLGTLGKGDVQITFHSPEEAHKARKCACDADGKEMKQEITE